MPRYDLRCTECGNIFEIIIPFGGTLPPCTACGSKEVRKKITIPGVIFKGEGFYKTAGRAKQEASEKSGGAAPPKKQVDPPEKKKTAGDCTGGCDQCARK